MAELNGNVKWWHLSSMSISLLAIIVTLAIFGAGEVIKVDLRSLDRFSSNRDAIMKLMQQNQEAHTTILIELQDIKASLRERGKK